MNAMSRQSTHSRLPVNNLRSDSRAVGEAKSIDGSRAKGSERSSHPTKPMQHSESRVHSGRNSVRNRADHACRRDCATPRVEGEFASEEQTLRSETLARTGCPSLGYCPPRRTDQMWFTWVWAHTRSLAHRLAPEITEAMSCAVPSGPQPREGT